MTPEAEKLLQQALSEVSEKHLQLEKEELIEQGRKKGKEKIAKNLKGIHTPQEISKITGLTVATILKL